MLFDGCGFSFGFGLTSSSFAVSLVGCVFFVFFMTTASSISWERTFSSVAVACFAADVFGADCIASVG
ncbi:hypothetical protein D3C87_2184280 [compost metagenome]